MPVSSFRCLSISPVEWGFPIASEVVQAGGVGLLDIEFCRNEGLVQAQQNLAQWLVQFQKEFPVIGLRLRVDQIAKGQALLAQLVNIPHWIVLSGWSAANLDQALAALPSAPSRQILLEVIEAEQVTGLGAQTLAGLSGILARGHECGGWVGEDAAFILFQKLLAKSLNLPVYVQGGIGVYAAAACRGAGAAGVVLDDQLWLMPESPLPSKWQSLLKNLNGQEAIPIGERLGRSCRVLSRPGFRAIPALQQLTDRLELQLQGQVDLPTWQAQADPLLSWGEPDRMAWPMGQSVGLAAQIRDRYASIRQFVQTLLTHSAAQVASAQKLQPLKPGSALAVSHGTPYPIVQGPMTRVSDTPEFANAVSQSGGLPLLALALMKGEQVQSLLQKTRDLLGDRPWGVGLLGFVSQSLREEQVAVVNAIKPKFALIAGGRPDQAAKFEAQGIATYIHVPAPRLLSMFLEQGAKRFVFEGRECGGHVGPLSSFVLWDSMIDTLLTQVPPEKAADLHILFAGGIHDAASAAMVSAMAVPLVERGMKIGVLMGTAYLFTQEAVNCGAILPKFQEAAIACQRTLNLETGPGHASRCAVTPFAQEFYATRRQMMAAGRDSEEIKNTLEDLTLGRLRVASKGKTRNPQGQVVEIEVSQQYQDGMYMIGQVATLRHQSCTVAALHEGVSQGSLKVLDQVVAAQPQPETAPPNRRQGPADIAIIGIGTLLPQAQDPKTFWKNILKKVDAVTEIPPHRWDWRLYYDEDRHARDKIYSKWGGFLGDVPFDPLKYGIPPKSLKSIEPLQLLALEVVRRALADAGYESGNFDREHTSVILGAGGGIADLGQQYATRAEIPRIVDDPSDAVWDRLPEWTEESFPGILLNVIAGRIANRFNLGGSNFTVDAACASSLAALDLAVQDLESGRSNVVIAGGVDTVQSPFAFYCFSKTQALSAKGRSRSFDKSADGIAISEGLAVVVLKRLEDAERDGDRVYAVIKATAGSSDGKALGLTAPLPAGQQRALKRAYEKAGFSASTIGLYEAHGTGTPTGDRAELETIVSTLQQQQTPSNACAIGSVKTLIGHTKSTAGIAGLVKATLALHHKVIPPHAFVENPLDPIVDPESPVYLVKEGMPWVAHPEQPRRAGVSAFGFGGTNFHAVLEEYAGKTAATTAGGQDWPWELIVLKADDRAGLVAEVQVLRAALAAGAQPNLRDLAYSYAQRAEARAQGAACLTLVVMDLEQLVESLTLVQNHLMQHKTDPLPPHIQLGFEAAVAEKSLAFLFPGQGSQYPDMLREVALYCPELRESLEQADQQLAGQFPKRLSQYIYPPAAFSSEAEEQTINELKHTQIAQPALGAVAAGLVDLLSRLGVQPTMAAGHSYGEYAALYCAGVFDRQNFLQLSATRGQVMASACHASVGTMAAIKMTRAALAPRLPASVVIANHNAPLQSVISGDAHQVQHIVETLTKEGELARLLPVAGAFHSSHVAAAQTAMVAPIAATVMVSPRIPVFSNETALPYPMDPAAIQAQLSRHITSPVNFVEQLQQMYAHGARVFVELGPKSVLTNLVTQILADRPITVVSLDGQGGGLRGFLGALGQLVTQGVALQLTALYRDRTIATLDLTQLATTTAKVAIPRSAWWVNGGGVRSQSEAVAYTGKQPPLTLESAKGARNASDERTPIAPSPTAAADLTNGNGNGNGQNGHDSSMECPSGAEFPPASLSILPISPLLLTSIPTAIPMLNVQSEVMSSAVRSAPEMAPLIPVVPPQSSTMAALAAYQAYQETMQQFLLLQEKAMNQFLQQMRLDHTAPAVTVTQPIVPLPAQTVAPIVSTTAPAPSLMPKPTATMAAAAPVPVASPVMSSPGLMAPMPTTTQRPVSQILVEIANDAEQLLGQVQQASQTVSDTQLNVSATVPQEMAPSTEREALQQTLVDIVSDRTGYPADMLGLDQDMEAELGIDSIKRVEILGALQKSLPAGIAETVQGQMESLTRVKTLNGLLNQLLGTIGTQQMQPVVSQPVQPAAAAVAPIATPIVAPATPGLDRAALTQTLVDIVSDRTGYPADMLGLDQDMEAELGIDSIKRVEILGALQKSLPAGIAETVQGQMESLTRVKSLNALIQQVCQLGGAPVGKA
jgi:acyl transferase domain-containing protein/NAD(P)H-dependent flavin oxidoreductase YrpB (nitropropane dioxygenase family)/acyl carrier protein